ncbi:MAG: hypothetical protein IPO76_02815 [Elusimicrobia bacterium]|nr:hypothetical protein [Elusimicrobiota bacterium]MBK7544897.1 hypothetical protein [Elusimicrobiota bacterium]MBK7574409.1 hypothetical protein [Elusimicrobiota bacterium]MBK9694317.1 hypothetical protein [Elusimicrobiota bacterium]MBL0250486.1 hypothetical protein [Elusimicrobiota bacterium]
MENWKMLSVVARGLAGFGRDTAFVGGAAVALHVTDAAAPPPRPTDDVDVVVEIVSRLDFHKSEEALRSLGFRRSVAAGGSICRWQYKGLNVDIMPTDAAALGFHNRWYADGLRAAEDFPLPDGTVVRAFSLPHMLASKIEAFLGRGRGDFTASHDIEDIFALLDGAPRALDKIRAAAPPVRSYLVDRFSRFLQDPRFVQSAEGHLPEPGRADRALTLLRSLR